MDATTQMVRYGKRFPRMKKGATEWPPLYL